MTKHGRRSAATSGRRTSPGTQSDDPLFSLGLPLALGLATFTAYLPSLGAGLVYDARQEILEEGFISNLSNLPDVLSLKVLSMNLMLGARPGSLLYLMLLFWLGGKEPFIYHMAGNFLHAANTALLFVLARRLVAAEGFSIKGFKVTLALVAVTLIFALHPIATEPVAAVNYCSDLLATFFSLLALLSATSFRPGSHFLYGTLGTLCSLAAVMCKESGLATCLLLVVYWWLFRRSEPVGPWRCFLGCALATTGLFLIARFAVAPPGQMPAAYVGGSLGNVIWIQPRLWAFMLGKLVWPLSLSADYTLESVSGLSLPAALLLLLVVVGLQIWLAIRSRIGALGVAIFWLGLITVSNFFPIYKPLADRFYYLPLAGVALQLVGLLTLLLPRRDWFWTATLLLLGAAPFLMILSLHRQAVFTNEYLLWTDTLRTTPSSITARNNLGNIRLEQNDPAGAASYFRDALQIDPANPYTLYNLGVVLYRENNLAAAVETYEKSLAANPTSAQAHNSLGIALLQEDRMDEATLHFMKALEINPNYADAHDSLGLVFWKRGRLGDAALEFQKALKIDPDYTDAHFNLGLLYYQSDQPDMAAEEFRQVLRLNPGDSTAQDYLLKTGH